MKNAVNTVATILGLVLIVWIGSQAKTALNAESDVLFFGGLVLVGGAILGLTWLLAWYYRSTIKPFFKQEETPNGKQ